MELSFLFTAVRKRPWIVVLGLVAGLVLGTLAVGSSEPRYQAQAVLLVQPPANVAGGTGVADADRYLQSQLSVLRSLDLAEKAAVALGGKWTRDLVYQSITISERVGTDVVDVFATDTDPTAAQNLANTYVELYKKDLEDRARQQSQADFDEIDLKLEELRKQLETLGQVLADEQDKYLKDLIADDANINASPGNIPPAAATAKVNYDTQLLRYQELLRTRSDLDTFARTQITTEIVQKAVEPTIASERPRNLMMAAGGVAGLVLGLLAAVIAARVSQRLIDDQQTQSILGQAVVGSIGRQSALSRSLPEILPATNYGALEIIDELCVRAEANARRPGYVTVVVVGTEQAAGASTIATAMAGQFARFGTSVVLVDADPRRSDVTEQFSAFGEGGIPALLAQSSDGSFTDGRRATDSRRRARSIITPTDVPEVHVLGRGDKASGQTLRRSDVDVLLERTLDLAPVVIVDAGAVLDAASTVELCRLADAVVLAVPSQRQKVSQLEVVARQLARRQGELLPVTTKPRHHRERAAKHVAIDADVVASGDAA